MKGRPCSVLAESLVCLALQCEGCGGATRLARLRPGRIERDDRVGLGWDRTGQDGTG